jgi:hypothetical protein
MLVVEQRKGQKRYMSKKERRKTHIDRRGTSPGKGTNSTSERISFDDGGENPTRGCVTLNHFVARNLNF